MLSDAACAVLDYCHIKELNHSLETVVVQMVKRRFNEDNEGNLYNIKMGEVSMSYHKPINSGSFSDMEKSVLNAHRRFRAG